MTRLAIRMKKGADRIADTDVSALRARVLEVVDDAMSQVERLIEEAPSASEARVVAGDAAGRVRDSRAVETAAGLIAAAAPMAASFARRQVNRRNASHAAKLMPMVVRTHPVLFGAALAGGAIVGVGLLRKRRLGGPSSLERKLLHRTDARRASLATGFDLDEEVARMEDEGGDPGAYDGEPPVLSGPVRTRNGNGSATR